MLKKNNERKFLIALGIFILSYGIFAIIYSIYSSHSSRLFWVCYIGMILIGMGSLTKNSKLVRIQLNILVIPLLIWVTDFFSTLILKRSPFGVTGYFFKNMTILARVISLEHFFLIPLAFIIYLLVNKNKKKESSLEIITASLVQLFIILIISRILTSPFENINCVFQSCISFIPTNTFYPLVIVFLATFTVLTGNILISFLLSLYSRFGMNKI